MIVKIIEDGNVFVKIVVLFKFKLILFNVNFGYMMIFLSNNLVFFICVLFLSNFIVMEDGKFFSGIVKMFIYFMDF